MKKYLPLFEHLCRAPDGPLEMTFEEIDALVGGLPTSAVKHKVWWNNEGQGTTHVQALAWVNAGRRVGGPAGGAGEVLRCTLAPRLLADRAVARRDLRRRPLR